jgi:hypothetical protein
VVYGVIHNNAYRNPLTEGDYGVDPESIVVPGTLWFTHAALDLDLVGLEPEVSALKVMLPSGKALTVKDYYWEPEPFPKTLSCDYLLAGQDNSEFILQRNVLITESSVRFSDLRRRLQTKTKNDMRSSS